jgi:integrase
MLLRRTELEGATVHGFRSSFRSWAREAARADHDVAELCLAHVTGSAVVQAYQRSDLLNERRTLMTKWAAFVWPRG